MKKIVMLRRASQAFFLGLFIYILWSTTYPLRGFLPPHTFFATNPHIMFLISLCERVFLPGVLISSIFILLTLIFGRFYCGWICPLGAFIDIAGALRRKREPLNERASRALSLPKFIWLFLSVLAAVFGIQIAWAFDPMVIMARFVSLNLIPTVTLGAEKLFIFLIRDMRFEGAMDIYRSLKGSILGVKVSYFENSIPVFMFFALILVSALFISRFWCRTICPLGATYAIFARPALFARRVDGCISCGACARVCRTGAIKNDFSYEKGECVLCMDCVYSCPGGRTRFSFHGNAGGKREVSSGGKGLSRGEFLLVVISSIAALGAKPFFRNRKETEESDVIRPPAALKEDDFLGVCIRCGNCMKVCPTNGLQPAMMECGPAALWTPKLVPDIGYCEYNCTLCGSVCPTGAIKKLTHAEKTTVKLGTAEVDRTICLPWAHNQNCIVCEEHCPVPSKAIKIIEVPDPSGSGTIKRPVVDKSLCVGCGICQTKCPVRPQRAIRVSPDGAYRP
ncbi:MAG: 4Fe-4S binding protein [Candidatus Omnitrophica bacterium]|nr:4Fe-4S binding protein [Candidatus Omnitrophota bacterium]